MTNAIKKLINANGLLICPSCNGDGENDSFCGHYTTEDCYMCKGNGIIKSLNKQKHKKPCAICDGREGGCGGCGNKGFYEWESFELI